MADYLPKRDSEWDEWLDIFAAYVEPKLADFGYDPSVFDVIEGHITLWKDLLNTHLAQQAAAQAATVAKAEEREQLENMIRAFVRQLQANPLVTDADKAAMGITVQSNQHTSSTLPPDLRPVGHANGGQSLKHLVHFRDESESGVSKAKPKGVMACEIWVKVGDAPIGPSELTFAKLATRTPAVVEHSEGDAGKTAYYRMRWVSKRGDLGSWSEVVSATIAA